MTYNEALIQVTHLYNLHLGRNPDSAGLNYWANALSSNQVALEAVASQISGSPEAKYFTMYLESLIQELYWAELGRLSDEPGMAYYLDALRRRIVTQADIRNKLRSSQEAILTEAVFLLCQILILEWPRCERLVPVGWRSSRFAEVTV
jgi:hypothetical protein